MKKIKIIQVMLVFIIFILAGYYLAKADSSYEIKMYGENITSNNNIDTINMKESLKDKNIINIHYDIYKDNKQITEGNFGCDILDNEGKKIELPYIKIIQSGFNLNEFDLYIDGKEIKKIIDNHSMEIIKEFYIDFYAYYVDGSGETSTILPLNCKRKIILDYEENNPSSDNLGNFTLKSMPYFVENIGMTNLTDLKIDSFNIGNNTYDCSLDIQLGNAEKIKQYMYDINLLAENFPFGNIMNISNVTINEIIPNNFIKVKYDNKIKNIIKENETIEINDKIKKIIISAERLDNNSISTSGKYQIIFNTLNDNQEIKVILNLTINLKTNNYSDKINTTRYVFEEKDKEIINKNIGESNFKLNLNYNKAPTRFKILNENQTDVTDSISFEHANFNEYLTYSKELYKKEFSFDKDMPEGFYTIETYEPNQKIYIGETIDESATLNTEELTTSYTFYLNKISKDYLNLKIFDNGKSIKITDDTININVPTDNIVSSTSVLIDGKLSNGMNNIENNFDFKIVKDLDKMENVSNIIIDNNYITFKGEINIDKCYLLVFPEGSSSYYVYNINIIHKGLKDLLVTLRIDPPEISIPSKEDIEKINLYPEIRVDGVVSDLKSFNYDYKIFQLENSEYIELKNENIYFEKGTEENIGKDVLYITDFAPKGDFMIECYISDRDSITAKENFSINYEDTIKNEYKIEILNTITKVDVPNKDGKINTVILKSKVLKEGIETSIKPTYSVSGDEKVSIKDNKLLVKSGAIIGNKVIIKAELKNPEGNVVAVTEKTFELVKEGTAGEGDITDDPDKDDGTETKVPKSIVLSGFETENNINYLNFSKPSGEQKILTYTCYDESGNIITNPSISILLEASPATGFSAKSDYKKKEIIVSSNGLFDNRTLSISFKNGEDIISAYTINLKKPVSYECTLEILQSEIIREGKITANATFKNNSLLEMKVLLAIVCYDKNESMVSYVQTPITLKSGSETKEDEPIVAKLTVPEDTRDLVIKAFLLDGSTLDNTKGYYINPITITNREDNTNE